MDKLFPFPKFDLNSIDSILQARKLVSVADKNKISSYVATEEDVRDRIADLVFLINLLDGPVVLWTEQRGYGLFAEKDYKVPERVTFYGGIQGYGLKGDYVVEGNPDVDGYYGFNLTQRGRFINEYGSDVKQNKEKQNVKMTNSMKFITIKAVKKGEEFFENYGKYYVRNYGKSPERLFPPDFDQTRQNSSITLIKARSTKSDRCNCYLIEEKYLIDAAPGLSLGVPLFLTHSHADHSGGAVNFKQVFVHENELNWIQLGIDPMDIIPSYMEPGFVLQAAPQAQLLTLDSPLEFIFTPGHSPGSVCYIWNQYLFTGDSLYDFKKPTVFSLSNAELWIASLQKIKKIILERKIDRIFGGHYNSMEFGRALERIAEWINFLGEKNRYC